MLSPISRVLLIAMLTLNTCSLLMAQTVDAVRDKFPNEYAVLLNFNRDVRIFFKNNVPVAETKEHAEILVLDDKANGLYNKYKIYHSSFNELKSMEAFTKVPDGNKYRTIKVTEVKTQSARSAGVFYDDTKESIFDFPSMVKGATASVSHAEFHKDLHLLTPFYFTTYLPVVKAKFTVSFPADMDLKYLIKNDPDKKVGFREERNGKNITYEFTSANLKWKDSYNNAPARSYYEPHVIIHIGSYKAGNGERVPFLNSTEDLYNWNYSFLKTINTQQSPLLKSLVDSLSTGITSEREKSKKIYRWVQEHIKYVAFEDGLEGFIPRQAVDVYNKRYGDCKDMASLITAMHQAAGIKAYLTWIGTRDIPYTYNQVPLPLTDNHMISAVNFDGQWLFLDGTDPNCNFGTPSKSIQGKQAMVAISEQEYKILEVPEVDAAKNMVTDTTYISVTDKGIKGKSSVYYEGYFATDTYNTLRYYDSKETKDYVKSRIWKGSNKYFLSDYSIDRVSTAEKLIGLKTAFEVPDYGKKIGDEYYINLNLDRLYNTSGIDTAKRKVPVQNDFKFYIKNHTTLDLPSGYKISYIPEDYSYKNDLFSFSIDYTQSAEKVVVVHEFKSDCLMLEPHSFFKWNEAVNELTNQYKKQLVLKKQ